ncbi:MAG: hypothetical protein ACR2NF_07170, partial [Pirellulales bacterium]
MNRLLLIALFNMCAVTALGDDPLSNQDLWFRCDAAAVDEFTKEITPSMVVVFDDVRDEFREHSKKRGGPEPVITRWGFDSSHLVFTARNSTLCLWLIPYNENALQDLMWRKTWPESVDRVGTSRPVGKGSVTVLYCNQSMERATARMRYLNLFSAQRELENPTGFDSIREYCAAAYRFFDVEEVEKLLSGDWIIFEFKENGKRFKFPLTGTFQGPYGEEQLRDALKKNIVQLVQEKGIVHKWDALSISGPIDPATGKVHAVINDGLGGLREYNMKKVKVK